MQTSLDDLARQIVEAVNAARSDAKRMSVEHALTAGKLLTEAKKQLSHGEWLPWLKKNCRLAVRTAQAYMRLAELWPHYPPQRRNDIAYLPLGKLLENFSKTHPGRKAPARNASSSGSPDYRCPLSGFEWSGDPRPPTRRDAIAELVQRIVLLPPGQIAYVAAVIDQLREEAA